jgi:hypothetical protein
MIARSSETGRIACAETGAGLVVAGSGAGVGFSVVKTVG